MNSRGAETEMAERPAILDNRTFDALVEEAKRRIPRYTQESWTDYNESDPGVALIELFAWLTETMLWEVNNIPERGYESLLQLLDIRRQPAIPAEAVVTFEVNENVPAKPRTIPRGTQMTADTDNGTLIFETGEPLDPVRYPVTDVRVFNARTGQLSRVQNTVGSSPYAPFGDRGTAGSILYIGFGLFPLDPEQSDAAPAAGLSAKAASPFPQRFTVWVADAGGIGQRRVSPVQAGGMDRPAPVVLAWDYKMSGTNGAWAPLRLYQDSSRTFTREGFVTLEGPQVITPSILADHDQHRRYWLRCRIASQGGYPDAEVPEIDALTVNSTPAAQSATVHGELLATSDATPGLEFTLNRGPVQPDTLAVECIKPNGARTAWRQIDTLAAAGPEDEVYMLDPATGQGKFGDDVRGRIPERGVQIVARQYRYGGGRAGNVRPGAIAGLPQSLPGIKGVTNYRRALGGADVQSKEDMKRRAPIALRSQNRAVTATDFTDQAVAAGGVHAATAIQLYNPGFPNAVAPGALTVFIVPERHYGSPEEPVPAPIPSPALLAHVSAALDKRRTLTSEVFVAAPAYRTVRVSANVTASSEHGTGEVERACVAALNRFLIPPLQTPSRPPVFGQDLYPSRLESVLEQVDGVAIAHLVGVEIDGVEHADLTKTIKIDDHSLLWGCADHRIQVDLEPDRGGSPGWGEY